MTATPPHPASPVQAQQQQEQQQQQQQQQAGRNSAVVELSSEAVAQLTAVLTALGANDNLARSHAEHELNTAWVARRPDELLLGLVHICRRSEDAALRQFAPVLARRLAFKAVLASDKKEDQITLWESTSPQTRSVVKNELFVALSAEQDKSTRHKLCDLIADISKNASYLGESWPELLQALLECARSPYDGLREAVFRVIAASPGIVSEVPLENIKSVFAEALQDANQEIRVSAVKAASDLIVEANTQTSVVFADVVNQIISVILGLYQSGEESDLTDCISSLIAVAENTVKPFRPAISHVLELMLHIVGDKEQEDMTRQTALELLLTLTESAPGLMKKQQGYLGRVLPLILEFMTCLEDDPNWYTSDDSEENDSDENYAVGEHAIDRLANALGGKEVVPAVFQYIPGLLGSEQWQQRYAGLMAVANIGEGCRKVMKSELKGVLDMVLPFLRDQHPRVRFAACAAVGQMSTDFGPTLQKHHHQQVLSALIPVMDDTTSPRVQSHAAAALVNFCEKADKNIIVPYLDAIFERLLLLLGTNKTYVQEQTIFTIATVADSAEDKFAKYYPGIMPHLMDILRSANGKEYRSFRGKAIECATLIAMAVGKDVFAPDASEFINLLKRIQESVTEADDPQVTYLLSAWARMCKVLGEDFVPHLEFVMPPLMKSVKAAPEFAFLDPGDDSAEERYSAEDGWEVVDLHGQRLGINTTTLEEKSQAVQLLGCYAKELGAAFAAYAPEVLSVVLPLLRFYLSESVREAAAACLPRLLLCTKKAAVPAEELQRLWCEIVSRAVEVLNNESDAEFLSRLYSALSECIQLLGSGCLDGPLLEKITDGLKAQLQDHYGRFQGRHEERAREAEELEAEDQEYSEEEEMDEAALQEMARMVHTIFKTHGSTYLPFFEGLLPFADAFMVFPHQSAQSWAVCVLDDMIEFTGPDSWKYRDHFARQLVEGVLNPYPEVRQAAAYGIGVAAQHGGENYAEICAAALHNLFAVINDPNARDEDNVMVTENAISAVGKICKYNSSKFDTSAVLPSWVASLPIAEDEEEAGFVYTYLLDLADSRHPAMLGANQDQIFHLVKVFTTVLVADILPDDIANRMVVSLKTILSGVAPELKQQLWNSIQPEDRRALAQMGYV